MRFHRSKLYISAMPPLMIGAFVGFLAAIMGAGGGFIMVPAMIYLLRVPTNVVVGTSLFQIVFVTAAHDDPAFDREPQRRRRAGDCFSSSAASSERSSERRPAAALKGEELRFLLAALVLLVCFRIGWDLVVTPRELYSISSAMLGGP